MTLTSPYAEVFMADLSDYPSFKISTTISFAFRTIFLDEHCWCLSCRSIVGEKALTGIPYRNHIAVYPIGSGKALPVIHLVVKTGARNGDGGGFFDRFRSFCLFSLSLRSALAHQINLQSVPRIFLREEREPPVAKGDCQTRP